MSYLRITHDLTSGFHSPFKVPVCTKFRVDGSVNDKEETGFFTCTVSDFGLTVHRKIPPSISLILIPFVKRHLMVSIDVLELSRCLETKKYLTSFTYDKNMSENFCRDKWSSLFVL